MALWCRVKVAVVIALALVVASFIWTARQRNEIRSADPCLVVPEVERCGYDDTALNAFVAKATKLPLSDDRTVLKEYRQSILGRSDPVFAICLGVFVILLGFYLAGAFPRGRGWFMASAAFGLLYTASDLAEDAMLAKILTEPVTPGWDVSAASLLTQTKMATLTLSVSGGVTFLLLEGIDYVASPPPECRPK